ncbi:FCSD flavin-binding domain-containing protein [Siccirubricoccus deserti]
MVVGGGFGGASAARFARATYPDIQVTLVEPLTRFVTCPYGNLLLGGYRQIGDITHSYDGLRAQGVRILHDWAAAIDPAAKTVRLRGGETLAYDKLILSPGIALRYGALPGYDEAAAEVFPHAWVPGDGSQTRLLRRQLEAMPDGGVVGIAIPANPFRCPPGPYERISMIAAYLKRHKPRSKVLALDAKEAFSKQGLFQDGWKALYGPMVEWVPASSDGKVIRVDPAEKTFESDSGCATSWRWKCHPAAIGGAHRHRQRPRRSDRLGAGGPHHAGLQGGAGHPHHRRRQQRSADAEIRLHRQQHGEAGGGQRRRRAARGRAPEAVYFNTCYSHVGEEYGISVVNIFRAGPNGFVEVPNSGGVSPRGDLPEQRRLEALYADAWYASITRDMFG